MDAYKQAVEFAAKAHVRQFRKGTDIPYIVHPVEVAQILTKAGADETLICVGLLHDVLEDTEVTAEELRKSFGDKITSLVLIHTEDKRLSWEVRKQHTIDYLKSETKGESLLVTCADKLSNMRSISIDYESCEENLWSRFNRGKEKQRWYYENVIQTLEPLHEYLMYQELVSLYQSVFLRK